MAFIAERLSDDITWHMVGDRQLRGKAEVVSALQQMRDQPATELRLHTVITHGREGAANGEITLSDGKTYAFCDVYSFPSAKASRVGSIVAYVIDLDSAS